MNTFSLVKEDVCLDQSTTVTDTDLDRQVDWELQMRGAGIERFWMNLNKARDKGQESKAGAARRLLDEAVEKTYFGIQKFMAEADSGKPGRKHKAVHYLRQIEPVAAAFIAVRVILDSISVTEPFQATADGIAKLIEDECRFRKFLEEQGAYAAKVVDNLKKQTSQYHHQRTVMVHAMGRKEVEWKDWPQLDRVHLGGKLIEIVIEETGLVEKITRSMGPNDTRVFVEATAETLEWITQENKAQEALFPVYYPTLIPPKPWTTPFDGGYYTRAVRRLSLVKTSNRAYLEELANNVEMPNVYASVNAMQDTGWKINAPVMEVLETLAKTAAGRAKLPQRMDAPDLPARPADIPVDLPIAEMTEEQQERMKEWKQAAASAHHEFQKAKAKVIQLDRLLTIARLMLDKEAFYFPYQLDFRGRVYAVPLFLNPQGSDTSRGLLTFAEGLPIEDQKAADWLAIHGAGMFGYDKDSLEGRVRWIAEHEAQIIASAENPYDCRFWEDADKPWQFLAFCFEWAGFRKEGWGYVSNLPVQMDGTCNGLQNFSAMLRDEVGGAAVNLVPSDKPNDIYANVAKLVAEQVEWDAAMDPREVSVLRAERDVLKAKLAELPKGHDEAKPLAEQIAGLEKLISAKGWVGHITRKVCKRPVMTMPYGSEQYGFKKQVFEDIVKRWKEVFKDDPFPWEGNGWKAADYLGSIIWVAVNKVVTKAGEAMKWLQGAAKQAAELELPVRWTTPAGLVVLQEYRELGIERVNLTFQGTQLRLNLERELNDNTEETKKEKKPQPISKQEQKSGIAPNWVHSCDAAHMQLTVVAAQECGISAFSLVHDSYGTHAARTEDLAFLLREQFVKMYLRNILADFKSDLEEQIDAELPDLPSMGSLNLLDVMNSKFFFS